MRGRSALGWFTVIGGWAAALVIIAGMVASVLLLSAWAGRHNLFGL